MVRRFKNEEFIGQVGYLQQVVERLNEFADGVVTGETGSTDLKAAYAPALAGVVKKVRDFIDAQLQAEADEPAAAKAISTSLAGAIDTLRVLHLELGKNAPVHDLNDQNLPLLQWLLTAEVKPESALAPAVGTTRDAGGDAGGPAQGDADQTMVAEAPSAVDNDTVEIDDETYEGILRSLRALIFMVQYAEKGSMDPFGQALIQARNEAETAIRDDLMARVGTPTVTMQELYLLPHAEFCKAMGAQMPAVAVVDSSTYDDDRSAGGRGDSLHDAPAKSLPLLPADDWLKTWCKTDHRSCVPLVRRQEMLAFAEPIDVTTQAGVNRLLVLAKEEKYDADKKVALFEAVLAVHGVVLKDGIVLAADGEQSSLDQLYKLFNDGLKGQPDYGVCAKTLEAFARPVGERMPMPTESAITALETLLYGLAGQSAPSAMARSAYAGKMRMWGGERKAAASATTATPAVGSTGL